jgi:hypothetical protein
LYYASEQVAQAAGGGGGSCNTDSSGSGVTGAAGTPCTNIVSLNPVFANMKFGATGAKRSGTGGETGGGNGGGGNAWFYGSSGGSRNASSSLSGAGFRGVAIIEWVREGDFLP